MPCLAAPSHHHTSVHSSGLASRARARVLSMEVSGSLQQHHLGDSFSYGWLAQAAPSFAAEGGHAFGSSRSSYIDMDDAELFSMRWTTTTTTTATGSDFDFGVSVPGGGAGTTSPAQLVSASQIFRAGRLLPFEPGAAQQDVDVDADADADDSATLHAADVVPAPARRSAPSSPLFHSAQSTPLSLSACSSATSNHAMARPTRRRGSSPWKVLLRYVRFLMPLYRKARALAPPPKRNRVAPAAGSPARGSTSSVDWCHGTADTAVDDAILYCKKSSGQDALP